MSVDIYSPEGTKVRFKETDPITWGASAENTRYLALGKIYTVEHMERHSYHTKNVFEGSSGHPVQYRVV